jgi:ornithine decarboxylase
LSLTLSDTAATELVTGSSYPSTARIDAFLADNQQLETPFLVVDLDIVRDRYLRLRRALPAADVFYAVKANPDAAIVALLAELGSSFDVASLGEIDLCLGLGIASQRLSYGNTVKKERDIEAAHERGVRIFAVDSEIELAKVVRRAPGSMITARLASDGDGADWPLSRKFGASTDEVADQLLAAADAGLTVGVSFHVGSQQRDPRAWEAPLSTVAALSELLADHGHRLTSVNLGGGLPSTHFHATGPVEVYGVAIDTALETHLGPDHGLQLMVEPGRYLVGDAGVIRSEVVLCTEKGSDGGRRWVYLDIGMFNGLVETQDEAIRYRMRCPGTTGPLAPAVVAGPTCDSLDVLYEREPYPLPTDLRVGGHVDLLSTGAYTTTYSSVWFNGFEPLQAYYLPVSD